MTQSKMIRVLLVDDEDDFRHATARALRHRGVYVFTARHGQQALQMMEVIEPDAVVLDVRMPGLDGDLVFDRIHQRWPGVPVILLTGHGSTQQAFETSRRGVYEYLAKPCPVDRLLEVIQEATDHLRHPTLEYVGPTRVLLVDDEPDFLGAMAPALRRRGFLVETCESGVVALDRIDRQPFEVVVLDAYMPGLGGLQLLRFIKARRPRCEVLLLSGNPGAGRANEAREQGACDCLLKPVSVDALAQRIREAAVRQRSREAEADAQRYDPMDAAHDS